MSEYNLIQVLMKIYCSRSVVLVVSCHRSGELYGCGYRKIMVKQWVGGSKCRLMQDTLFSIFNVLNGNGMTICNINVATVNGFHYHSPEALC